MFTNTREWTVEWGDCDPAGIVFFPRFFAAFDTSTSRLIEAALGKGSAQIFRENGIIGWPMVDVSAKFLAPASFGEVVTITTRVTKVGRSSIALEHRLGKDGQTRIDASEVRVWAAARSDGSAGIESVTIPSEIVAALRAE